MTTAVRFWQTHKSTMYHYFSDVRMTYLNAVITPGKSAVIRGTMPTERPRRAIPVEALTEFGTTS